MMMINRDQGEALTTLLALLRPDWGTPGIRKALQDAQALAPAAELAVAACRVAANPDAKTPAVISLPGPHWAQTTTAARVKHPECVDHPGNPAGRCQPCEQAATPPPPNWRNAS